MPKGVEIVGDFDEIFLAMLIHSGWSLQHALATSASYCWVHYCCAKFFYCLLRVCIRLLRSLVESSRPTIWHHRRLEYADER